MTPFLASKILSLTLLILALSRASTVFASIDQCKPVPMKDGVPLPQVGNAAATFKGDPIPIADYTSGYQDKVSPKYDWGLYTGIEKVNNVRFHFEKFWYDDNPEKSHLQAWTENQWPRHYTLHTLTQHGNDYINQYYYFQQGRTCSIDLYKDGIAPFAMWAHEFDV